MIANGARDAELRHTQAGKAVANIRLATNRVVRDRQETQRHSVVCWAGFAETTSTYVKKGDPLYVEGRLQYRTFQNEEGKERDITEVVAGDVQILGSRKAASTGDVTPVHELPSDEVLPDEISF